MALLKFTLPIKKVIYPISNYSNVIDLNGYIGEQYYNNGTNLYAF